MDLLNNFMQSSLAVYIIGALGGLLGFLISYKELGKMLRMLGTSTSEIAQLQAGEQVQIVGQAQSIGTNITSPITEKACVVWQLEISEKRRSGRSTRWVTVYKNYSSEPFEVSDGTGRVRLEPVLNMELVLQNDVRKSSGVFSALDADVQNKLTALGLNTKGFIFNKSMQVNERFVEQGEQVYILGTAVNRNGVLTMDNKSPLIVSDHGKFQLMARYAWKVFGNILLFAIIAVAIYLFFLYQ